MNKYLRKLGFRRSDELEMRVTIKAIKFSWTYMMAFLAIWSILTAIDSGKVPMIHICLILTGELSYFALQWWYTRKEVREDENRHVDSKRLTVSENDKHKYEYIYEDEHGNQYVYEEVEVDE